MAQTGASANVSGGDPHLKFANVLVVGMCSGLHYLKVGSQENTLLDPQSLILTEPSGPH